MSSDYEFEKYICDKYTLRQTIDTYGVAIIPNVLNDDQCQSIVDGIWDFLEHITQEWTTPIDRNNIDTWKEFYKLYPKHSMLLQHWGVGHAQVSWDIRQNINIIDIFAHFWNCNKEDLLVSFDGFSLHLPPEITNKGWFRGNTWYHTDQSYTKPDFKCIQSFITGLDINPDDATLTIMEGSNKYHSEFRDVYNITDKTDWYRLTDEQYQFYYDKGCQIKYIKCPKGSLVLWDSRTIHCGIEPTKKRSEPTIRSIIYLCYMPRHFATKKDLEKKKKAFNDLRTTNHYPCKIKLFSNLPRTYGGELPNITPIPPPDLDDIGETLAGF